MTPTLLGCTGSGKVVTLTVPEFEKVLSDTSVQLVDVRTPSEYGEGHIPGALNIDVKEDGFEQKALTSLDAARPVALYCRSGRRSAEAAVKIQDKFPAVYNLSGGIIAWQEAGKAVGNGTTSYEVDEFTTPSGKTVRMHALVHASIWMEYGDKNIYVDPVTKLGEKTIDYTVLPKADYIFVTHEHGDHFDKSAISDLSGEGTVLVTNARCADMLGLGKVMANGDRLTLEDDIRVEAVPAYNITEGRTQFHPKGRDNGYVIGLDTFRVYVAGDTEDVPEMKSIKDIDVAFLPCNQPYTMTVPQLVSAAKTISPKVLFPYHYSKTELDSVGGELPGMDVRIRSYQ